MRRRSGRRHNARRRNPFSASGFLRQLPVYLAGAVGGVGGLGLVKTLDGLYTFPVLQNVNVPGTTATVGDTLQSVIHASVISFVGGMAAKRLGRIERALGMGLIIGSWVSVLSDLIQSATFIPTGIQQALSGYPRGMGAIAPGSTYMPALTAGPVFNPQARMAGYPVIAPGRGF